MNRSLGPRLSLMMFLQFFVWGAWYTIIGNYMVANGMADLTHWPYTVNPIAAIVAPFFLGLVADRYFPTEKVLGVLHLLGGVFMFMTPGATGNPVLFIGLLLLYNLCYMPTLGLANLLAFTHITDQEKQFPLIRVFGTIGWIVAGLFIGFVLGQFSGDRLPDQTALPLYTTAIASIVLGFYSFSLPHTPPPGKGQPVSVRSIVGLDALQHLKGRAFYVFLISSMLICIPLAAYYNQAAIFVGATIYAQETQNFMTAIFPNPSSLMTIGQMSEALFLLVMPFFFRRLGVKWMLALGMLTWVVRYAFFAIGAPAASFWLIALGVAVHGMCYDFFFVTGQIYVDKKSTPAIRSQAQGLLVFATYGVGLGIGAPIVGGIYNAIKAGKALPTLAEWQAFWWVPAAFALGVLLLFVLLFRDDVDRETKVTADLSAETAA